jgi:ribosomal protein S18 acetylase RimI-like enzyme
VIGQRSLASALEFQRRTLELVAEEARPIDGGWLLRDRSLPLVWLLNSVRLDGPIGYGQALALSEEFLGDLPYRHLAIEHEASARRVEPAFRADGWEVDREVTMALVGTPGSELGAVEVIEPSEEETLALARRWVSEDPTMNLSEEGLRQLGELNRRVWGARDVRLLGVRGEDGALVAITNLYSDSTTAQVEDVYTVPEARGHGLARALVTRAITLAHEEGHELIFIVADDNDWPKHLYRRLGFEAVGRAGLFHRPA